MYRLNRRDLLKAAGSTALLLGTASWPTQAAIKKGGYLKAGMSGGASNNSLDPATIAGQTPVMFSKMWGETLVESSAQGELTFRLAQSVESNKQATQWNFKIRQGVEFHNGKTLTAQDVLKTMQRHAGPDSKSGALGIMRGIESMSADKDIFTVNLNTPNADLPYLLSDFHLIIQPNGGFDKPDAGIGTGAYKVEIDEPGIRHAGQKFANYWDDSRGHAEQVEIMVFNDTIARTSALQSGQVHMINAVDPKVANLLKRHPGISIQSVSGRGHYVFPMHTNTAPFDNYDLRLALKYAIDREELVQKVLRGYGSVGNDFPINAAYPLFSDDIEQRSYDPDKAKFHFKKSGHQDAIVLRTSDAAFPGAVDAALLFQQSAAKAGINIDVQRLPNDGYWSNVWNKKPFCASFWKGRPVQDQMYSTVYQSTSDWNDTRFSSPQFDSMLLAARGELDQAKRKSIYRDMAVMLRDQGGVILPMFNDYIDAVSNKIAGYQDDPNGELMDGRALLKTWLN